MKLNIEQLKKPRNILAIILVGIIAVMLILVLVNKDNIFKHEIEITYPDQCVEQYEDGELISPECTTGREMLENANKEKQWYLNTSLSQQ